MSSALRLLESIDVVQLSLRLAWAAPVRLPPSFPLWLRRRLHEVGGNVLSPPRFAALFDPPLPSDPEVLRRYQRPTPPFVLYPVSGGGEDLGEGDETVLELLLLGNGIALYEDFLATVTALGRAGVVRETIGCFDVAAVATRAHGGELTPLRPGGAPQVLDGRWWLERPALTSVWRLRFVSPARLISQGRPLFTCTMAQLIPFALRRVGSMLANCCNQDLVDDHRELLAQMSGITVRHSDLTWCDWNSRESIGGGGLGGVVGEVCFAGEGIDDVLDLLMLAAHLNIGRGASYGAGHFLLTAGD